ncbi:hypothetical protein PYW08_015095 [Mythimna loreyi]|uniref:Uncharacterized protein n=1 Tax=Mythimna loreyi TaxID=667449 RepID=A0ACC2R5X3_9NEOP|nr:hypothetical protein PYW08_015095 [Mythimna loreyi]
MSVSVRSVTVEGPQPAKSKGPFTYANTPKALYNNAKLKVNPSWLPINYHDGHENVENFSISPPINLKRDKNPNRS